MSTFLSAPHKGIFQNPLFPSRQMKRKRREAVHTLQKKKREGRKALPLKVFLRCKRRDYLYFALRMGWFMNVEKKVTEIYYFPFIRLKEKHLSVPDWSKDTSYISTINLS